MMVGLKIWGWVGEDKCGGHYLPSLDEIGLTDLPKSGGTPHAQSVPSSLRMVVHADGRQCRRGAVGRES